MSQLRNRSSAGFTIIEVAVIVPILIVTALFLFQALFVMIRTSTVDRANVDMLHDSQSALAHIESDALLASDFLATPDAFLTASDSPSDPYQPSGGFTYKGSSATSRVLLARTYSTTTNPRAAARNPVYVGNPSGSECTGSNAYLNSVMQYNVIYFVKNNDLFRRKVIDSKTNTCVAQYQKRSCPSVANLALEGIGSRNAACQADDELLARDVTNFSVQYYDSSTGTTPLNVYATGASPSLLATAVNAEITISISRKAYGEAVTSTSTFRLAKINVNL